MRIRCSTCLQPEFSCFCGWIHPFDCGIEFVILIHPIEVKRRRITTGRMAHLFLRRSHFFMGQLYGDDTRVNSLLADPARHNMLLYPGKAASNLSFMSAEARMMLAPPGKQLTIFVVDGTWATAKKTVNQSPNIGSLPRICFSPTKLSNFRVRKQPRPECYSTIEAIHSIIDLVGPWTKDRRHDILLSGFDRMVDLQIRLAAEGHPRGRSSQNETSV